MHIILCLDDRNGISFNRRRLSSDRAVCRRIAEQTQGALWMNTYSAKLFAEYPVCIAEDFLAKAGEGDSCFVEDLTFADFADQIQTLTVYRWNRAYPADQKLPAEYLAAWHLTETCDFSGNSHDVITEEKYTK